MFSLELFDLEVSFVVELSLFFPFWCLLSGFSSGFGFWSLCVLFHVYFLIFLLSRFFLGLFLHGLFPYVCGLCLTYVLFLFCRTGELAREPRQRAGGVWADDAVELLKSGSIWVAFLFCCLIRVGFIKFPVLRVLWFFSVFFFSFCFFWD